MRQADSVNLGAHWRARARVHVRMQRRLPWHAPALACRGLQPLLQSLPVRTRIAEAQAWQHLVQQEA